MHACMHACIHTYIHTYIHTTNDHTVLLLNKLENNRKHIWIKFDMSYTIHGDANLCNLKPGIHCARLPRADIRVRQTRSFVHALITVIMSGVKERQPHMAVDRWCERNTRTPQDRLNWKHSTLKSLCRRTKNRSDLARHGPSLHAAVFVLPRVATWYRLCEAKQWTLTHVAATFDRYPALQVYCDHITYRDLYLG
jgi:hypothetical protein